MPDSQQRFLWQYCSGQRVLFINSIRADQPSGGNSCTQLLLSTLRPRCILDVLQLAPDLFVRWGKLAVPLFILASMPGALFALTYRIRQQVWLQWFFRVSPVIAIMFLTRRYYFKPDVVVLNHHSVFFLLPLCKGLRVVTVWHDLPSLAQTTLRGRRESAGISIRLEQVICRYSDRAATFAHQDARVLRRVHGADVFLLPVVGSNVRRQLSLSPSPSLLFVGNWTRPENANGFIAFMTDFAAIAAAETRGSKAPAIHIAGFGAASMRRQVQVHVRATPVFEDFGEFDDWVLVVPVLAGAGIKLKTIEAWAAGLPVIGTEQAFSGLPRSIWALGGICFPDVKSLAVFAADVASLEAAVRLLHPSQAFAEYSRFFNVDSLQ